MVLSANNLTGILVNRIGSILEKNVDNFSRFSHCSMLNFSFI